MIAPRWRKILRDLTGNLTRTVLVVLSIAVGVFAVGMILSSQIILNEDLTAQYLSTRPASAVLFTAPFGDEVITAARTTRGVEDAEGRRRSTARIQVGPDEWKALRYEATDNFDRVNLNVPIPQEGTWPPRNRELVLERASLENAGFRIGDTVTVETPDGRIRELRIGGTVHDLNKAPPVFTGSVFGYVSMDTMEWLGNPRNLNELHLLVNSTNRDEIRTIAESVQDKLERGGTSVLRLSVPDPGKHPSDAQVQPMLVILGILGALSLVLSGFLVVNTISALLTQQIRQIGIMKAIGGRTRQIVLMYLGGVLLFAVLSLAVAVPLGALAAYFFSSYMAGLLNFDLAFRLPLESLAVQVAIGLTVPLLAALVPVLRGVRVSVREALQSAGGGGGAFGRGAVDGLLQKIRGVSRPTLLSMRNTFRRKARLALTLFTLTLSGAIFIAVLTVNASFLATLDEALEYWNFDVDVQFGRTYRTEQILEEVRRIPAVVFAETWTGDAVRRMRPPGVEAQVIDGISGPDGVESDVMRMLAVPADTQVLRPSVIEGRWILPEDGNAVVINTDVQKTEPDVGVGSTITLKVGARDTEWTVVGIVKSALSGPFFYSNQPYYQDLTNSVGRAGSVQVVLDRHDPAYQLEQAQILKDHFDGVGMTVLGNQTAGAIRSQAQAQIAILTAFLAVMAVILAVVGGLGLMGTMSINVLERSREIGVMRAIGAADRSVLQIFLVEGVLIGVISFVLGTILSVPIGRLMSEQVGVLLVQRPLTYAFATDGAALWLVLVVILAALASLWPSIRASRISVREVLAYE